VRAYEGGCLAWTNHPTEHREQERYKAARQLPRVGCRIGGEQWVIHLAASRLLAEVCDVGVTGRSKTTNQLRRGKTAKELDATGANRQVRTGIASKFCNSPMVANERAAGRTKLVASDDLADVVELLVGLGTQSGDTGQANDDDQSQHDSVLNCRWAIFFFQEVNNAASEILHLYFSSNECRWKRRSTMTSGPIQREWVPGWGSSLRLRRCLVHGNPAILGATRRRNVGMPLRTRSFASRPYERFAFVRE